LFPFEDFSTDFNRHGGGRIWYWRELFDAAIYFPQQTPAAACIATPLSFGIGKLPRVTIDIGRAWHGGRTARADMDSVSKSVGRAALRLLRHPETHIFGERRSRELDIVRRLFQ
jgi:hypothetical protein